MAIRIITLKKHLILGFLACLSLAGIFLSTFQLVQIDQGIEEGLTDNFLLGKTFLQKGNISQAQAAFTKAILQDQKNKEVRIYWLLIHLTFNPSQILTSSDQNLLIGNIRKMREVFEEKNDTAKRLKLGKVLLAKKEPALALIVFQGLTTKEPLFPLGFLFRGLAQMDLGNISLAREDFIHSLSLDPNNLEVINFVLSLSPTPLSPNDKEKILTKKASLAVEN